MDCENCRADLSGYLDSELADRSAIERHLATCEACSAELRSLEGASAWLRVDADAFRPDPNFLARFRERVDDALGVSASSWRWLALRLAPVSATAAVLAFVLVIFDRDAAEPSLDLEQEVLATGSLPIQGIGAESDWMVEALGSSDFVRASFVYSSLDSNGGR